jgi:hypothetical protein
MIDADGSTDPAEIPAFVAKLVAGDDFVKGSRFDKSKGGHSHDITRLRKLGNDGLNLVVNVLFGTRFTDLCYGYNAFWRGVVPTLALPDTRLPQPAGGAKLWGDGFEIETMINIRAAVDGMKVGEVGSVEHRRIHGETNLNTFRDGFRVLRTIFSEYGRMRKTRRTGARPGGVIVHQAPAGPKFGQMVNRPAAVRSPAPVKQVPPAAAPLNRAARREDVGSRRTGDIKPLRTPTAIED